MKFGICLLLSLCALIGAEEECSQERAEVCVDSLLSSLLDGGEEEEVCKDLRQATDCLRNEVEKCLGDDRDEEVEEGMQSLENILKENCQDSDTEEKCSSKKAEDCVDSLLSVLLDDSEEEAVCKELRQATNCLKTEVENCLGDDHQDEDVEEGLQSLENILKEKCQDSDEDDELEEINKCVEGTEDDANECLEEKMNEMFSLKGVSSNALKCMVYFEFLECYLAKIGEKCGQAAYNVSLEEAKNNVPETIEEACKKADLHGIVPFTEEEDNFDDTVYSIHLLGDDRKKK